MTAEAISLPARFREALRSGSPLVITRTPMRISFVGGGTDIAAYYRNNGGGAVVNAAIDKYAHILVNRKFDNQVRVSYSQTEVVSSAEDVRHPLVREALRFLGIRRGVEIVSVSDIPTNGSGLGGSSSFTVGLLHSLHAWLGEDVPARQLAEEAVRIERDILQDAGGKQDQYIAAYGGLRFMEFRPDESVTVTSITSTDSLMRAIERQLLLFYTGTGRAGAPILSGQIGRMKEKWDQYTEMRQLAYDLWRELEAGRADRLGEYLHKNWTRKRQLHEAISSSAIDAWYDRARAAGATGGKITGAGGGGFLLLCVPPERRSDVRRALPELREEPFRLVDSGSRVIYPVS